MKRFLVRAQPSFDQVLIVESGSRDVAERALRYLYSAKNPSRLDLLTCYDSPPDSFDFDRGVVYSVHDPEVVASRGKFIGKLTAERYTLLGMLCTGSPILAKWKLVLALRSNARLIVINEEANYFGLDFWNLRTARLMVLRRLNPFGDESFESLLQTGVARLGDLLLAPFSVAYLLLSTGSIHLRRWWRTRKVAPS